MIVDMLTLGKEQTLGNTCRRGEKKNKEVDCSAACVLVAVEALNRINEETFALKPWVLKQKRRTALQPLSLLHLTDPAWRDNVVEGEVRSPVRADSALSCARECFVSDQNSALSKD